MSEMRNECRPFMKSIKIELQKKYFRFTSYGRENIFIKP